MEDNCLQRAIETGKKADLVDVLERVLSPNDQAWFICSFSDCSKNDDGHCVIYTIAAPPILIAGKPCKDYERRA